MDRGCASCCFDQTEVSVVSIRNQNRGGSPIVLRKENIHYLARC